jgi:hypothetical protein
MHVQLLQWLFSPAVYQSTAEADQVATENRERVAKEEDKGKKQAMLLQQYNVKMMMVLLATEPVKTLMTWEILDWLDGIVMDNFICVHIELTRASIGSQVIGITSGPKGLAVLPDLISGDLSITMMLFNFNNPGTWR